MRSTMALFATAAILVAAPRVSSAQSESVRPPQIVTSGVGEARVTPDRATILIGVQSRASTASAAGADNARRQRAIIDTLRALGLPSDEIRTTNYSVSPEMQYNPGGQPPRLVGYTVSNSVSVDVRRIEDVGRIIDAALAKGANQISSLSFYSSKADSVRHVAMAEAVAKARADAETLARAAGGTLGGLLELSSSASPIPRFSRMAISADTPAAARTPIEPGQEQIEVTVTGRWAYVPRGT